MFKDCCGCGRQKKVSDSSVDFEKEQDDVVDKGVAEKRVEAEKEAEVQIDVQVRSEATGVKEKPQDKEESAANSPKERCPERKAEVVSSAAKNPGLVVDTTCTVPVVDDEEDDDTEVFPMTPRTASMATPHPSKRNSTPGLVAIPKWISLDDDDEGPSREGGGATEPPVTPVGRDELALRRHRFFSDLLVAAQAATEHRVRFDPLGPSVAEVSFSPEHKSVAMSVGEFSGIIQGPFTSYLKISTQIGGDVAAHSKLVADAFQTQLQYLQLASSRSAPSQTEVVKLLQPTSQKIQAIQDFREKSRASPNFNHLSAISESIGALGWVTVSPAPAPYIKEMNDAGQFYTNRVLKEWKQKDQKHVEWVKAWVETLLELQKFVKQHHTTGLVWSGAKMNGAPPPPPPGCPPPPPVLPPIGDLLVDDGSNDRSALFAAINQGENITRSLKKVTDDMQTHKNKNLRSGPAPFKAPASKGAPVTASVKQPATNKPPVFARDGKKWLIEYQQKNQNLVVEGAEMNNVVYMYGCTESTLTVKGKINSVFLDSCKKSAVVFDTLVSSIEFVNCQSVHMQVLGKVPTISIDKTDGCQIYLSKDSLDVEITSSKSSEMNVLVPTSSDGDFAEYAVPEQYKTTVKPTGLTTIAIESKG